MERETLLCSAFFLQRCSIWRGKGPQALVSLIAQTSVCDTLSAKLALIADAGDSRRQAKLLCLAESVGH